MPVLPRRSLVAAFAMKPLVDSDWKAILAGARLLQYKAGEVVIKEGGKNDHLYRVNTGTFLVSVAGTARASLRAGDIFGEASALGLHYAKAEVVCKAEGSLWCLGSQPLDAAFQVRPDLGARFWLLIAQQCARRLLLALDPSDDVSTQPVPGTVHGPTPQPAPTKVSVDGVKKKVSVGGALLAFQPGGKKVNKQNVLFFFTGACD